MMMVYGVFVGVALGREVALGLPPVVPAGFYGLVAVGLCHFGGRVVFLSGIVVSVILLSSVVETALLH